jgi:hypothetical protein
MCEDQKRLCECGEEAEGEYCVDCENLIEEREAERAEMEYNLTRQLWRDAI